jgi:hypothetical protein
MVTVAPPSELGGRAEQDATVSWVGPDGPKSVRTATPTQLVAALQAEFGGEVPRLTVTRPTLEDVYLGLIGQDRSGLTGQDRLGLTGHDREETTVPVDATPPRRGRAAARSARRSA